MSGRRVTVGQLETALRAACEARGAVYGPDAPDDPRGVWLVRWAPGDRTRYRVEYSAGGDWVPGHAWRSAREMLAVLEVLSAG